MTLEGRPGESSSLEMRGSYWQRRCQQETRRFRSARRNSQEAKRSGENHFLGNDQSDGAMRFDHSPESGSS